MIVRSILTGSKSVDSKDNVIGCWIDSRLRAVKGPKTSSAVRAGNKSTAMCSGATTVSNWSMSRCLPHVLPVVFAMLPNQEFDLFVVG